MAGNFYRLTREFRKSVSRRWVNGLLKKGQAPSLTHFFSEFCDSAEAHPRYATGRLAAWLRPTCLLRTFASGEGTSD